MVISVNRLSIHGAVADMIEEISVGQRASGKPAAPGQLDKEEILTQPPRGEVQANEERQGNLLQEHEQRFEKFVRRPEVIQVTKRKRKSIFMLREYTIPRDQEETRIKGWIQSNVRFGPVSDIKVLQSLRKIQYWSSGSIFVSRSNRILDHNSERYWRICQRKEEQKASVKPAAKARPRLKPSSTSGWDFTLIEQRQWIDIETQESKDPYCFQVSKFITRLLRHCQIVNREGLVDNTERWLVESREFVNATHWSIEKWTSVLAKGGGQKNRVSILVESEKSSINFCTFEQFKDIQEVQSILHRKTMYCFQKVLTSIFITSETEKNWGQSCITVWWIVVWFQEESVSNRQTRPILHCCESRWMIKMAQEKPYATCHKQESRHTKVLGNAFKIQYFWCNLKLAQQRGLQ